jgi:hypothetical protein
MVCYCPTRKILYIHLPKCGGMSCEAILIKQYNFRHFTFPDTNDPYPFLREPRGRLGFFRYILKYSNEAKVFDLKSFRKFAFVRNPHTRGVSGIRYLHECSIRESFIKLPNGTVKSNPRSFPHGIDRFYLTCLNRDYYYNHFCLPQSLSIEDDEGNIDFRIGRFENFMGDLKTILFDEYGLEPFDIDKIHVNKSKDELLQLDVNKVYEKIAKIHENDFKILGYDIDDIPKPKIKHEPEVKLEEEELELESDDEDDEELELEDEPIYECNSHDDLGDLNIEPPSIVF